VIVLDGCGAGFAPDAEKFNDFEKPNTLLHVWERAGGIDAPNLIGCGYFWAAGVKNPPGIAGYEIKFGKLQEVSQGKDSVTGHWEMMGIHTSEPFPTYPNGFPPGLIAEFERMIGTLTLCNCPGSGTTIIDKYAAQHMDTGMPIVYTSADSVFQIACHEEKVAIQDLYEMCRVARKLCVGENNVQRVIARPFVGTPNSGYRRTERRKDFPLDPAPNLLDAISDKYGPIVGIGVVPELFNGRGFVTSKRTQNNAEHGVALIAAMKQDSPFIFANFEDTDMLYGHRNDPDGFARALKELDGVLQQVLENLREEDMLILTADHGNDPTDSSTDHSREYTPFCVITRSSSSCVVAMDLQIGFWHIGNQVAAWLNVPPARA
jgi:phosphopentomutase